MNFWHTEQIYPFLTCSPQLWYAISCTFLHFLPTFFGPVFRFKSWFLEISFRLSSTSSKGWVHPRSSFASSGLPLILCFLCLCFSRVWARLNLFGHFVHWNGLFFLSPFSNLVLFLNPELEISMKSSWFSCLNSSLSSFCIRLPLPRGPPFWAGFGISLASATGRSICQSYK